MATPKSLLFRTRLMLAFFMLALVVSGITAFPLKSELHLLNQYFGQGTAFGEQFSDAANYLKYIQEGLDKNAAQFPFMSYGTDWLAFAHIVIAIAFIGPFRDPVRNIWVTQFGMICCILVFPLAMICGTIRGIPMAWQLIDCSFGFFGLFPLLLIYKWTKELEGSRQ
ncbi:MAG: hypothetical protein IKX40_13060 [Thermoguttaceae bacterium]|nr:hypothetical protein [Thermoguttaceae bacterium]